MKKIFITGNQGKFREVAEYIPNLQMLNLPDIQEIQSLDIKEIIRDKLKRAKEKIDDNNCLIIVEDTGLYLNALNGFPGPLIKFMLKSVRDKGIFNICSKLKDYKAKAITVFGVFNSNTNEILFFPATINGLITFPKGKYGFGWDRIFIPKGSDKTFAEMESIEEKKRYSMRYKALKKILNYLKNL